ncbi:MAG TPA: O-antigen ligase family protein [Bryobacteraceae bacterium]|jgi:O-antigen ligase|nr:O-antigen ligase family protein [Bryobacteraceae bacterium]
MAALLPLAITPGLLFHYDITPKIAVLALAAAVALASSRGTAATITSLLNRKSGRWLAILAVVQIVWFAVATGFSTRPWFSLFGSNWRRMGLLTIIGLLVFTVWAAGVFCRDRAVQSNVLRAIVIAALVASIYAIGQYFDIDPLQSPEGYHAQAGASTIVRPPGTLGHADYFGWWLAIAFFCAIYRARVERRFWRWTAGCTCALSAAAIILSGTRSAMLGVVAGLGALGITRVLRKTGERSLGRVGKPLLAGMIVAGIVAGFYFSPAGTRLRARVRWSVDEPIGGARPLLWRDSLRMAGSRPWTGFGPETFAAEFPRYQSLALARLLPDFYHESPHNTLLDAFTEEGVPGLLIALSWAGLGAYAALRAKCPALTGALTASYVASMFGAVTIGPIFATLLVIALLIALDPPSDADGRIVINPTMALAVSVPLAACLAGFGIWLVVSDFNLARFERNPSVETYDSMVRIGLPGAAEDLYCARRFATMTPVNPAATLRAAARATATADNPPNAWYNLAIFLADANDATGVERTLRASTTLAPNWFKPHLALANLFVLTGRAHEARIEAGKAMVLDAGKDPEVAETFLKLAH